MDVFKKEAYNYLSDKFPSFKPNTLTLYSLKLAQLNFDINKNKKFSSNFDYLNDYNNVFKYIKSFKTDNQLAFLNVAINVVDKKSVAYELYKNRRIELNRIKSDSYNDNTKNDDFVDYDELLEKTKNVNFRGTISEMLMDFILYMSIRYPIRLDLCDLIVTYTKRNIDDNYNYLYVSTRKIEIVMNKFKNVDSIGKTIIPVDKKDEVVIRKYLNIIKKNNIAFNKLILNYYGQVREFKTHVAFGSKLKILLGYKFPNKNLTMNSIRNSYETKIINSGNYASLTNREKNILHNKLLHRMETAHKNYNKV